MRSKFLASAVAGVALVLAACGDDSPAAGVTSTAEPTTPPPTTPPPTTDTAGVPQAIVSLSPTATEVLYAIGAGDQVIKVDIYSNFPPEAAAKAELDGFQPSIEAIADLEPDLVVNEGTNPDLVAQLDSLGIAHLESPAAVTFDDIYTEIEQLGAATGHIAEAAELVAEMQIDIDAAIAGLPQLAEPLTYYHELSSDYYSVTSDTFIGAVYAQMGLVNIADEVGDGNSYPQLSAEYILDADPDLIFLADTKCCGETAETVGARDGWSDLAAVRTGNVILMDDDIASRWGPRIVDYIEAVGAAVARAAQPVG